MTANVRLSTMMFLQYAIWGAWLPILWPYLAGHRGFDETEIGWMFAVGAVGALLAPFVSGQLADRAISAQKVLGASHLLGAVLIWQLAHISSFTGFLAFSLAYSLVYAPTLPISNAVVLHHAVDVERDFARIRLWGTVGWIVAGIAVGQWLLHRHTPEGGLDLVAAAQNAGRADAFRLSAVLGAILGVFCFLLPDTPPSRERRDNASLRAAREIGRRRSLVALFLVSVPMSCVHQFYFVHTSGFLSGFQNDVADQLNAVFGVGGGGLMTIGQMTEVGVLAAIPWAARCVSKKTLLLVGVAAYAVRMALFAYLPALPWPPLVTLVAGVALHGLCFGCFVFVAFMVVDEETTPDVRSSAQSLYNLVLIGIGIIVGSTVAGLVATWARGDAPRLDYADPAQTERLFAAPMWVAAVSFLVLAALFPRRSRSVPHGAPA